MPRIFSTWDPSARQYDYWQAPGALETHAGAPPRASGSPLGATPEQAAWRLPTNAQRVGSGEMPQGRIATMGDDSTSPSSVSAGFVIPSVVLYAGLGYVMWRYLLKDKKR